MALTMTIDLGNGTEESLTVPEAGPITIGRDESCHVVLPSPDVSRRHLTVEPGVGVYRLTDASANGTLVGDSLLHRQSFDAPGGLPLRVGPYVIRLALLAAPAHQAPVPHAPVPQAPIAPPRAGPGG